MATKRKARVALKWSGPVAGKPSSVFGERQVWSTECGLYRIERFPEGRGRFKAISLDGVPDDDIESAQWGREKILADKPSLRAAQEACREHAKK